MFKPFVFKDARQSLEFFERIPNSERNISNLNKHRYCLECPLNHPSFMNVFGISTCCHANYLALTGQLDTEGLTNLINVHVGATSLFVSCRERRELTRKFFHDLRFEKVIDVE